MKRAIRGAASPSGRLAATVALVAAALVWSASGGRMFAPAALSSEVGAALGGVRSHAELTEDCRACHVAPWSTQTMESRCLACHADVQAELADSTRLHGTFASPEQCRACHTEHHGPAGELTRLDASALDHDGFGFSLDTHRRTADDRAFACSDCHARDSFAFEAARCEGCHREYQAAFVDEHVATWGEDCRACHDGTTATGSGFSHEFPLVHGSREPSECAVCHQDAPRRYQRYTCYGCHEHTPAGIQAEHDDEGISRAELADCVRCHATGDEHDGDRRGGRTEHDSDG